MKSYRSKSGPFAERPYYTDSDIENTCTDELRKLDLLPAIPSPIRIDRFAERRFLISLEYGELPEGILGLTKFGSGGVQGIVIARKLDEEGTLTAERRIRTTIAHETGHGLLHTHLFAMATKEHSLFGDFSDPKAPKVLCRDVVSASPFRSGYDGRWWEFHANRSIGPLLMPRELVQLALEPLVESAGTFGTTVLPDARRAEAIATLAQVFNVNPVVAKIRLQELYPDAATAQLRL